MLAIASELIDAIKAHARQHFPLEVCGVIAGQAGSNRAERFIPMHNAAQSRSYFQFDSREQLHVWKEMDARSEEPVVLFHSHTQSRAFPSREDIHFATQPQVHYLIVSLDSNGINEARSFRILHSKVTEEIISVF